jgi:hypothetical protein
MACRVSGVVTASLAAALASHAMPVAASSHDLLPAIVMVHPHLAARAAAAPPTLKPEQLKRPAALPPLYIMFASLQVLDADSTRDAMARGYEESNPVLKPVADNSGALLLVKIGATAATIVAVEKLWRKNRVAAVLTMVAVNTGYAIVVANNYGKARVR